MDAYTYTYMHTYIHGCMRMTYTYIPNQRRGAVQPFAAKHAPVHAKWTRVRRTLCMYVYVCVNVCLCVSV